MIKRILCLGLSMLMIVTIMATFTSAAPVGASTTSEEGIQMIKDFEGFSANPIFDSGTQWTIGYGNVCNPANYPNGITQSQADALLRSALVDFEESINRYTAKYNIILSQQQFDAIASITYNLGISWINSSYRFWTMLREGIEQYTDNQIASAIGVWSHVGTTVSTGVLQRRIAEIRVFLYGDYEGTSSPNFKYLIFNGNGGSIDTDVMLYRENEAYGELTGATKSGSYFAGWFTTDNTQIREDSIADANRTLSARWSSTPVATSEPSGIFSDVQTTDWFYKYVIELSEKGIVSGFQDRTFRPQNTVTAGQALSLITLAAGYSEAAPTSVHWASGYLSFAEESGFLDVNAVSNLDETISRELVAKVAAKALDLQPSISPTPFADCDDAYITALYEAGVIVGNVNPTTGARTFKPQSSITRAEIAVIVWTMS